MNRAILVREKIVRLVGLLTEKKIRVTQRGSRAFVTYKPDGRPDTVNVPYIPDDASETFLGAIEGFLDHEVAHVLFTDHKVLAKATKAGVEALHNIIEDAFIEQKMAATFQGSGLNLKNVGEFFLSSYTDKRLAEKPENATGILMVPAIRAMSGQAVYRDYMDGKWHLMSDFMKKAGDYAKAELPKVTSSEGGLVIALKIKELLSLPDEKPEKPPGGKAKGKGKPPPKPEPEDEEEDPAPPEDGDSVDEDGDSVDEDDDEDDPTPSDDDDSDSSDPVDEDEDEDEDDSDDEEGDPTPATVDKGDDEKVDKGDDVLESSGSDDVGDDATADGSKMTSAWDDLSDKIEDFDEKLAEELTKESVAKAKESDYTVYTTELDVIEPMTIGRWDDSMLKHMTDSVDHMLGPLQKDLERAIEAKSRSTWSGGHRSGRMHASALSRLRFGDDRIFRRKHESKTKDVAVELVIDCSGSMAGGKIRTAAYAAYGLSSVLDRMQIAHEVIGFTTAKMMPPAMNEEARKLGIRYSRHKTLYMPIFKSFGERLNTESRKRFAALPNAYFLDENVDGESIQIAARRLSQRREARKIMIVLSDGQPACPGDSAGLRKHLKTSVKEIERSGIDVLGLGIMSEAPKSFYTKTVILNDLAALPTTVISEIKRMLMK